jgi:hypothetical protein
MNPTRNRVLTLLRTTLSRDASNKKTIVVYAGLDSMSSDAFVSMKIVRALKLPLFTIKGSYTCKGLSNQATRIKHFTELRVGQGEHALEIDALVVDVIGQGLTYVPPTCLQSPDSEERSEKVDMDLLLSVVQTWMLVERVQRQQRGGLNRAIVHTKLGPCGAGEFVITQPEGVVLMSNKDLERAFDRFHSLESIGISCSPDDERRAEEVEAERLIREAAFLKNKEWTMPILFKPEARPLRNNVKMAERRLISLERKLERDPELKKMYLFEIKDLFDRGDARYLRPEEIETPLGFLHAASPCCEDGEGNHQD